METRVALIGIIVSSRDSVTKLNDLLHEYGEYVIGRMGIPYSQRQVSVISVVMDAPQTVISALSGKLGMLPHVSTKTVYAKLPD
jgi:putative iron-only hydrogenase system regulator